jgi:hypothetical protein
MSVDQSPHQHFLPRGWRSKVRAVAATLPETVRADSTVPPVPPPPVAPPDNPSILGFPAEVGGEDDDEAPDEESLTVNRAAHDGRLVVVRRPERFGGAVLVLAGVAAGLSLWFPWVRGDGFTGLSLVTGGLAALAAGGSPADGVSWQPLAVVGGGGALLLLGVLLFLPAATHRLVGVLAFVVAETAAAGILTPLAASGWSIARFDVGMWCAVAVPVLGLLGALKAMLTAPRLPAAVEPGRPVRRWRRGSPSPARPPG